MRPVVGSSRPASNASKVDLPAPDAPMIAALSPRSSASVTSDTMVSVPSGLLTCLLTLSARRTGSLMLDRLARRGAWFAWWLLGFAALTASAEAQTRVGTILVMGDSLSAGYGMRITQSWVALLEQRLRKEGYGEAVVNASVSGETSAGGRARFTRALEQHHPTIVILELGANDALRGLPIAKLRANLDAMIVQAQQSGAKILLLGIRMPPNYGEQYASALQSTYAELAAQYRLRTV